MSKETFKPVKPEVGKKYINFNYHVVEILSIDGDDIMIRDYYDSCNIRTSLKYMALREEVVRQKSPMHDKFIACKRRK